MSSQRDHIELIERYLSNEMPEEEKHSFEKNLSNNKKLSDRYKHHLDTVAALKTYYFKEDVSKVHQEYIHTELQSKRVWMLTSGIAASIALITICFYILTSEVSSHEELFKAYFEPYPSLETFRGEESQISEAMDYYSQKKYKLAVSHLTELLKETPDDNKLNLYLGISYVAIHDYDKAKQALLNIRNNDIHIEQANWYLAMSYLASNDLEEVKKYLKRILPSHYKYDEAKKLYNKIQ